MPIWKPFIDWMAAWALPGLSKLTNPGGKAKREREGRMWLDEEARTVWGYRRMDNGDEFNRMKQSFTWMYNYKTYHFICT